MSYLLRSPYLGSVQRHYGLWSRLDRAIICESCRCSTTTNTDTDIHLKNHSTCSSKYHTTCRRKYEYSPPVGSDFRHFRKEVTALGRILQRSGLYDAGHIQRLSLGGLYKFSTSASNQQSQDQDDSKKSDPDKDPEEEEKMPILARLMLTFWVVFFLYITLRVQSQDENSRVNYISWNEFHYDMLAKGEVEQIVIYPEQELVVVNLYPGAIIKGRKVNNEQFALKIVDTNDFENKVRRTEADIGVRPEQGVSISYHRPSPWLKFIFFGIVALAVILLLKNVKFQMPNASDLFAGERRAKFVRADLQPQHGKGVSFKDVAGLHEAKVEIMEFLDFIKHPDRFKNLGGKAPKGALLLGPPGCGKTLLAKALAHECNVPFLALAGSEFVEMIGGLGAARVRDLFKEAGQKAPAIIYIDEIDAIGRKRSGENWSGSSEEEHTLNQLLVEMDGMSTREGVVVLASTNRADILDKALLRPGRFDRHIMIDYPTLAERKETFDMYLRHLKLGQLPLTFSERMAQLTPGMTGADIANVCNEAALHAARDTKHQVDPEDFEYAVERVLAGVAKKTGVLSGQEKKIVAYHEAGHALVGWLLEHTDSLLRVSIIPRTSNVLGFAQYMPADKKLYSKEHLFEMICMALGGRVAESLTFNSVTSGAQNDLEKVTKIAYNQICQLGMNERVGLVGFPPDNDESLGTKPYSRHLAQVIDEEARILVAKAYQTTEKLLQDNKEKLRVVAEGLLDKEVLTYKDMEELVGPPTFTKQKFSLD